MGLSVAQYGQSLQDPTGEPHPKPALEIGSSSSSAVVVAEAGVGVGVVLEPEVSQVLPLV